MGTANHIKALPHKQMTQYGCLFLFFNQYEMLKNILIGQ